MPDVSVLDVAKFIINKKGPTTAMKLQKLVYYCQAWSLVWDERPLFCEKIEAWANGPVVPRLYDEHRGQFLVHEIPPENPESLDAKAIETIEAVLLYYADKPSQWLSDLTHLEDPWRDARKGLSEGERGNREITHAALAEYYGSLSEN